MHAEKLSVEKAYGYVMPIESEEFNILLLRDVNFLELISTVEFMLKLFLQLVAQRAKMMRVKCNFWQFKVARIISEIKNKKYLLNFAKIFLLKFLFKKRYNKVIATF
jgi:hypothetical protein